MRKYLNQKGSALVLVMSSIIILMAVSTVVMMVSAANVTMSKKYNNWTADYYKLDYAVQSQLTILDQRVLIEAENSARNYLQNTEYQSGPTTDDPALINVQSLLYNKWYSFAYVYDAEEDEFVAADPSTIEDDMEEFVPQAFEVLYYAYLNHLLPIHIANYDGEMVNTETVNMALEDDSWFSNVLDGINNSTFYDDISDTPQMEIVALQTEGTDPLKQVTARITLVAPGYNSIEQTESKAVKVNPLYTNALSVQGDITFTGSGTIMIAGDVVSNNYGHNTSRYLSEGNEYGIKTAASSSVDVTIRGNVQSAGDVHLLGSGSSINVEEYENDFSIDLKEKLYNQKNASDDYYNNYFFDFDAAGGWENLVDFTEEGSFYPTAMPFIYADVSGGNVFCNNLAIESGVQNGELSVAGNVWTQDDIQNDGKSGTNIHVEGNYVGMRSEAGDENKDPNASSAVVNNAYLYGGTIQIDGGFIIPGTSWYKFNGVGAYDPDSADYYQTAESATSQVAPYFQIYWAQPEEPEENTINTYYVSSDEYYDLFEYDNNSNTSTIDDRIMRFIDSYPTLTDQASGVSVNGSQSNYTLGVVPNSDQTLIYDEDSQAYIDNNIAYSTASHANVLTNIFTSKTLNYGTDGQSFADLSDNDYATMDSDSKFYCFHGNASLDSVDNISSGIIYVDGDLRITSGVTFSGAIICSGDVTIDSGVTIRYDESVVKDVLGFTDCQPTTIISGGSSVARSFFAPAGYAMGDSVGREVTTSVSDNAGERDEQVTRYTINEWKESKQ